MKAHNIYSEVKKIDTEYLDFLNWLKKQKILKSSSNSYTQKDREDFLAYWESHVSFFKRFQKTINKSHYRSYIFKVNYNKLVLRRYLLVSYFNLLVKIIEIFWKHEEYFRILLEEEFKISYDQIAKFLYKPRFIALLNTPKALISVSKFNISDKYIHLLDLEKIVADSEQRLITNYKNFYYYFRKKVLNVLFSVSKHSWKVIAATKFSNRTKGLISNKSLKQYLNIAQPGDIFLSRGNWNASNVTIPGFWKHMSMYIWTGEYLQDTYGKSYSFLKSLKKKSHYIIEATWEWVKIVKIQDFTWHNDYLWISRTTFTQAKIKRTISNALSYYWAWYDHIFNFYSNKSVVCSELVLKSYWPKNTKDTSITLHLEKIGLNLTYPPNKFVSEIFNPKSWLEFVMFIDSVEKTWENFISSKKHFKKSASRSRFSFMLN